MQLDCDQIDDAVFAEQIDVILDTVADRAYPTARRRAAARQAVAVSVTAYNPRDPVETTIAGHCIVYDNLLCDGARDIIHGQTEELKNKTRTGVLGCGKMYLATLTMLMRMQGRLEGQLSFARPMAEREERPEVLAAAGSPATAEQVAARPEAASLEAASPDAPAHLPDAAGTAPVEAATANDEPKARPIYVAETADPGAVLPASGSVDSVPAAQSPPDPGLPDPCPPDPPSTPIPWDQSAQDASAFAECPEAAASIAVSGRHEALPLPAARVREVQTVSHAVADRVPRVMALADA